MKFSRAKIQECVEWVEENGLHPQPCGAKVKQFCQALQIAKAKGEVRYSDIRKDIDSLLAFPLSKASGYNLKSSENRAHFDGMTMADYMRWLWNNPQAGQNLYKMFEGIVVPTGKDEDGNLIYKYKGGK